MAGMISDEENMKLKQWIQAQQPSLSDLLHGSIGDIAARTFLSTKSVSSYLKGKWGNAPLSKHKAYEVLREAIHIRNHQQKTFNTLEELLKGTRQSSDKS